MYSALDASEVRGGNREVSVPLFGIRATTGPPISLLRNRACAKGRRAGVAGIKIRGEKVIDELTESTVEVMNLINGEMMLLQIIW